MVVFVGPICRPVEVPVSETTRVRLPRSSYEELTKIVKAYGRFDRPVSLADVAQITALNRTKISSNNAFLTGIGVIEGGNRKSRTDLGLTLSRALEHEMPSEIARAWAQVVQENEFLSKMVQAVTVRRGMEVTHLQSHIAFSAGESKSKEVMTGARAVVDILRASQLVREENDQIHPAERSVVVSGDIEELREGSEDFPRTRGSQMSPRTETALQINVNISVDADGLDDLGTRLRHLIDDFLRRVDDDEAGNSDLS
jgi:hypothetical protein